MESRMYVKESEFPVSVQKSGKGPRGIIIALIILFIVALGFMAYRYFGGVKGTPKPVQITPTSAPTQAVTPTSMPTATPSGSITPTKSGGTSASIDKTTGLDRANLSVMIENGSGVAGVAGKMSSLLTKQGYDVTGSGNADVFTYTNVTIRVKPTKASYIPLLKKDLSDVYTVDTATKDLPASSSYDALVIVGK